MENQKKKKWTVFFLVKSIDGTINYAITMINELRAIRFNNEISIVLCLHVAEEHLAAVESGEAVTVDTEHLPEAHVTAFYRLGKPDGQKMVSRLIPEYKVRTKHFEITDPGNLQEYMRDCILKDHASERYMLFTWGHGSCYGIFKQLTKAEEDAERSFLPERLRSHAANITTAPSIAGIPLTSSTISTDTAEDQLVSAKYLSTESLRDAIAASFGSKKIDVIAMMNCYMQFFDAGYALANVAGYFVAPETYMYFDGYNYIAIFEALAQNPCLSARELSTIMIESFAGKDIPDKVREKELRDETTLFANDLSLYPAMATSIREFLSHFKLSTRETKQAIAEARGACIPLNSGTHVIDFGNLLLHLQDKLEGERDLARIKELLAIKEKMIVAKYTGGLFVNHKNELFPSGFSVFFPMREEGGFRANWEGLGSYEKTDFFSTTGWGAFIKHFR